MDTGENSNVRPISYHDVDTVFLDVGNTLVTMDFSWVSAELSRLGLKVTPEALCRAEAAARPLFSSGLKGRSTERQDAFVLYLKLVLSRLPGHLIPDHPGMDEVVQALTPLLRPAQGDYVRLWSRVIPAVPEALASMKAHGLRLVAVSNSNGTVEEILIRHRLRDHLAAVFDSHHVGFEKPDPRIFQHVIRELALDAGRIIHVGDLYHIDVEGAWAAGLHAVLMDPYDDWGETDCERFTDLWAFSRRLLECRFEKEK